ncbi:MAG: NUDIX hydrolase [Caldilineaceae bacterium]
MPEHVTKPITASRRYPSAPLVGVGVVVFNAQGEVLLIQRGNPPRAGEWALPGGLIDLGERLVDGARREVREECGIEIELGEFVATFEPMEWDDAGELEYHYVIIDYWARHVAGAAVAHDDALAVAWSAVPALEKFRLRPVTHQVILQAYRAWQKSIET